MDEYADEAGNAFAPTHPLSFAGIVERVFLSALDPALTIPREQVFIPNDSNIDSLAETIEELGGMPEPDHHCALHAARAFQRALRSCVTGRKGKAG